MKKAGAEPKMDIFSQLKRDEDEVLHVYKDSRGIRTAGVGHNLEAHGIDLPVGVSISQEQCDAWLSDDVQDAAFHLNKNLPWSSALDDARHGCLLNMCFNMGIGKLLTFHRTLTMVEAGNYDGAAEAMLESAWAGQVGERAVRLSAQLKTGQWQ